MSMTLNKVTLIGHLGKDPEIRTFQSGGRVANFSVATSERWKDKASGEQKEKTQWHNIAVFNEHIVAVVEKYMKKGDKVYIEGQLETRKWQDQSGADKYTTEVCLRFDAKLIMLSAIDGNSPKQQEKTQQREQQRQNTPASYDALEDEIPF